MPPGGSGIRVKERCYESRLRADSGGSTRIRGLGSPGAGLRVGWIAPGRYRERVTYLKYATGQATPSMETLAVADYLEQGGYDRFLRGLRRRLEQQVQRVINHVRRHFPAGTRVARPRGGFVVWVALPTGLDSLTLQQRALAAGITFAPGPFFSPTERYRNCMRLSCAQPWTPEINEALARLGKLAAETV